jgi:hypothetical protein
MIDLEVFFAFNFYNNCNHRSFANTELTKNILQQIIGSNVSSNFPKVMQGLSDIQRQLS